MWKIFSVFILVIFTMFASEVRAQSISSFKERLTRNDAMGRISVDEHDSAMSAVDAYTMNNKAVEEIEGYRVSIYSGNSQNARSEALQAQKDFESIFPNVPTLLTYSEPYFTLSVGVCRDMEEALVLWGRVKNFFPKAFIMNSVIPIGAFMEGDVDYTAVIPEEADDDSDIAEKADEAAGYQGKQESGVVLYR